MEFYYKVTNKYENHHGFQYQDGLNTLKQEFNNDPNASCVPGGLYFTTAEFLPKFYAFGVYLRTIHLPRQDPLFKMVADPDGDKWRVNRIILGRKYDLGDINTYLDLNLPLPSISFAVKNGFYELFKYLVERDVCDKLFLKSISLLSDAIKGGNILIVKYLVEQCGNTKFKCLDKCVEHENMELIRYFIDKGADPKHNDYCAIKTACCSGNLEIVKYFIEYVADMDELLGECLRIVASLGYIPIAEYLLKKGANLHHNEDQAFRNAVSNGCIDMVKYLYELGMNKDILTISLSTAILYKKIEVAKFLIEHGADIHADDDRAFIMACRNGLTDIVVLLYERGANINAQNGNALIESTVHMNLHIVKFLIEKGIIITKSKDKPASPCVEIDC